ncbi:hypothetical protein C7212DRAFT_345330 [Tuber magnatum]|uniref:Uncharacterized protein n=1 Tax=Tuber magnatum TaxID=42249 RepID=A0A317SPF3_9PEZI|nr:hypothetical protein C7212DRAFT_345330 [Tuber magnatum]
MPERGHNSFTSQLLLQMQNLPTSNATNLPPSCDEELADEADEPPDDFYRKYQSSNGEFAKHAVHHQPHTISLLTRALLINPGLEPTEPTGHIYSHSLKRGMSTDSTWSNPSTMELTSDGGMTTPSRANTPSPPPPAFLGGLAGLLHGEKDLLSKEPNRVEVAGESDIVEGLGRKRCITFACQDKPATSRRPVSPVKPSTPPKSETTVDTTPVKRSCALKFVCTQRGATSDSHSSPQRPASGPKKLPSMGGCRDSQVTAITAATETTPKGNTTAPASMETQASVFPDKFYEFASSVDDQSDSWTHQPFDKSRILKVDDLLKKELDIRKLSQEAEEEALQEEEEEDVDGDEDIDGGDGDDDEDEDQDYDYEEEEEEEEEEEDALSGNESDNEAGFASESDDDDDTFFTYGPMLPIAGAISRPVCCRTESTSSIESLGRLQTRPARRPRTPDLPDSTDFVCGTLDEDKPLEEAYVSCIEERKRSKHIITPQDIDPSFPSDPENSDYEENGDVSGSEDGFHFVKPNWSGSSFEGARNRGRRRNDVITQKALGASPKGKARAHSPAPICRVNTSPRPAARRTMSPPPFNRAKHRSQMFQPRPNIFRTKSLPRTPSFFGRKAGRTHSAATSPKTSAISPIVRRGAIDIVKGLEKRRERRKARLCKAREGVDCRAGQGVEKMRELGLEICGKGKGRTKAQWVLSA